MPKQFYITFKFRNIPMTHQTPAAERYLFTEEEAISEIEVMKDWSKDIPDYSDFEMKEYINN